VVVGLVCFLHLFDWSFVILKEYLYIIIVIFWNFFKIKFIIIITIFLPSVNIIPMEFRNWVQMRKWVWSSIHAARSWQTVVQYDSIEALHQYWDPLVQVAGLSSLIIIIVIAVAAAAAAAAAVVHKVQHTHSWLLVGQKDCLTMSSVFVLAVTVLWHAAGTVRRHDWKTFHREGSPISWWWRQWQHARS